MIRASWIAAVTLIATVAIAETITRGTNDTVVGPSPPSKGFTTKKMLCSQHECRVVTKPTGAVVTECACDTATQVATDYCNNAANGIPCLNATGRLPSSVMPDGGTPPVVVFPNATKTVTGTQTILLTDLGAMASAALAHTVGCTATYHTGTGTGTATDTATGTAWGIGKDPTVTCTGTATSMPSPMPVVCPVGATCAGKTATDTTTSTATGTGGTTFYATAAQPVSATVASTYTLPVAGTTTATGTNTATLGGVKVGAGVSRATDGTISVSPSGIGAIATSTISGAGVTVDISGGAITGTHAAASTYTLPAATASVRGGVEIGSGVVITGDVISATPDSVGAMPSPMPVVCPVNAVCMGKTSTSTSTSTMFGTGTFYATATQPVSMTVASTYTLPVASPTVLGGVKIGSGVTEGTDGTISVSTSYDAAGAAAARAAPGTCSGGQYVSATTTSGVTCGTPASGVAYGAASANDIAYFSSLSPPTVSGYGQASASPGANKLVVSPSTVYLDAWVTKPIFHVMSSSAGAAVTTGGTWIGSVLSWTSTAVENVEFDGVAQFYAGSSLTTQCELSLGFGGATSPYGDVSPSWTTGQFVTASFHLVVTGVAAGSHTAQLRGYALGDSCSIPAGSPSARLIVKRSL